LRKLVILLGTCYACPALPVGGIGLDVIQAPKPEPRMMRYDLTNFEWAVIRPFLPNKRAAFPSFLIGAP